MTTLCHDHTTRCESVATPFCVLRLTPWCELGAEDLSGRCSRLRLSLPPHPLGKGTDSCLTWTPFSPHSTSSSMTFASPTVPNSDGPVPRPPFPQARSSPFLSSPDGRDSPASETSTATPTAICEVRSPPCPSALSSTGSCASMLRPS